MDERGQALIREVTRVLEAVAGGDLGQRVAPDPNAGPELAALARAANGLGERIAAEVRGLRAVTVAVARGELDTSLQVEAGGELRELNHTINTMLDNLRQLAGEAHRVATEVGGPARARAEPARMASVSGLWKELTDNMSLAEQLALVSRTKSELIANMSHELRTPLNSLLILAKLLSDNREANLTPKQVEYARTIYGSGGDLLGLINEILDLAKVESGTLRVEPTEVDLAEVQDAVERTFRPVAEQKQLGFSVARDADAPQLLTTDARRLQQVLRNLVANALKFTHQGQVSVRIRRAGAGAAFAVTDSGIGIPVDSQERIFEPFQQAEGSTARRYGGTGLGLSISLAVAHLLGGDLTVTSEPGRGSTFTLTLPERIPAETAAPTRPPPAPPPRPLVADPRLAGRTILVVDDDVRHVFTLAALLEAYGAHMLFAESAIGALAVLDKHPGVDVVLAGDPAALGALPAALPIVAVGRPLDPTLLLATLVQTLGQPR